MRDLKKKWLTAVANIAYRQAVKSVRSACIFIGYQPKEPEMLKKLKND